MTQNNPPSSLRRDLWLALVMQGIGLQYRRSRTGLFWITFTMTIFCLWIELGSVAKTNMTSTLRRL